MHPFFLLQYPSSGRLQLLHIHHRHLQIRPLRTQRARQAPDGRGRGQLRKVTGEDRDAGGGQEPGAGGVNDWGEDWVWVDVG